MSLPQIQLITHLKELF